MVLFCVPFFSWENLNVNRVFCWLLAQNFQPSDAALVVWCASDRKPMQTLILFSSASTFGSTAGVWQGWAEAAYRLEGGSAEQGFLGGETRGVFRASESL